MLVGNGIRVTLIDRPSPTPTTMWTVRRLGAAYGMAVTASHNPALYNGIKIFLPGGRDADQAVTDELLNGPPGGGIGQEAPVVADDDALLGRALLQDAVGQPLGQEPDIGAGELIADHGSPAAGAEVDHGGSSAEAPLPGTGRRGG